MSLMPMNNSALNNQSEFNILLRTVVELSDDNQKKIQESLERICRQYAQVLEDAAKVCKERGHAFSERIIPVVTHGTIAYRADSHSIRQKYENVVLTATKLNSAISSSQAEARIIARAIENLSDAQSHAVKDSTRKVIEEGNRYKEVMHKHIREFLPPDAAGGYRGPRGGTKSPNFARPGGGPVLPEGGYGLQRVSSRRSLVGLEKKTEKTDDGTAKNRVESGPKKNVGN